MSLMDRIHEDIGKHLHLPVGSEVVKIEETVYTSGGCDTCGYGEYDDFTVYVSYIDDKGKRQVYTESVSLVDFLSSIK